MHRSSNETKRLAVCLFLSALLHLAVVLLTPTTPDPQPALQVVFRPPPRTLEMRAFDPTQPALHERQMQRLVVKAAPSQLAQEPAESAPLGEIAEQLPPEARSDMAHLEKRMQIEQSGDVNIDSLLLAYMAEKENFREDYVRFPLAKMGADRDRALEVIERAIEAMGGRKRLLAIKEMSAMVWIEANSKELEKETPLWQGGVALTVIPVTPYLYPVATWHYAGLEDRAVVKKERYKVEVSFDPAVPNPSYVSKNPKLQRRIFEELFNDRWSQYGSNLPPSLAAMRHRGEEVRWHFIDRFLGEGVALDYLGQERSRDGTCHDVVLVDDRKYGHYFEALFDCRTALLSVTKEKLTPQEEQWFRQTNPRANPPTWITVYDRYQEVQGVLTPHRWERAQGRNTISVYLQWAYNGAEPSTAEPVR
ncbi:MAG: hypothetical protein J4F35_16150 [Candidatus Latescibacteria bacterium]|nr:hypothetical protein [Candidatus Latescibacterota bacterium]